MPKFRVQMTQICTSRYVMEVEAATEEEALEIAEEARSNNELKDQDGSCWHADAEITELPADHVLAQPEPPIVSA